MNGILRPTHLPLPDHQEIHAWVARLPDLVQAREGFAHSLSDDEQQRAARFHREPDRVRYIAAHGVLRCLLGGYLGESPEAFRFSVGPNGKPALHSPTGTVRLDFNLSHSGDLLLFAFGTDRRVGADVEAVRQDLDHLDLARRQFSVAETADLESLAAGPERVEGFFRCWTRKEAYLKARGDGLGYPLKDFTVTLRQEAEPAILHASDDSEARQRWSVFALAGFSGYAGTVVGEGRALQCQWRVWPTDIAGATTTT